MDQNIVWHQHEADTTEYASCDPLVQYPRVLWLTAGYVVQQSIKQSG